MNTTYNFWKALAHFGWLGVIKKTACSVSPPHTHTAQFDCPPPHTHTVYKEMAEAVSRHTNADVLVNFASLRSAYEATVEAMNFDRVSIQVNAYTYIYTYICTYIHIHMWQSQVENEH